MNIENKARLKAMAALLGLMATSTAMAGEEVTTSYIMNFYADSAHGAAIGDGAYEQVIADLGARDTRAAARVASQINLCIAYTKTNQIDKATEACDAAPMRPQ